MDKTDQAIANFARKWFAELTGDSERYDIERLEGKGYKTHGSLDAFVDELCELVIDASLPLSSRLDHDLAADERTPQGGQP